MNIFWTSCTIQDLQNKGEAELKTGPFGTQLHASDYVETGTPVINVRNIGFGEIREEKLEFIAEETVQRLSSHLLEPGDIVFGRKGAVERHAFINPKYARWFQGSDCLRLRVKSSSVDSRFLSYYFLTEHHKQWMINQCSHGATMASLNQAIISRIPLLLPPIHTQRKIISILSAYDDLIENNTRRIEILEEMARSLYREWFVNFRSETDKVENRTLNDICEFIVDCEHKTAPTQATGYPSIRTPNIGRGRLLLDKVNRVSEEIYKAWTKRAIPKEGDLILAREAPVGNVAIIPKNLEVCLGQRTVLIRPYLAKVKPYYLLFLLLSDEIQNKLFSLSNGATVHHLNLKDIRNLGLPELHSMPIQNKINTFLANYYDLIFNLTRKIENLRQTRDLLLPKLISGEINVENFHNNTKELAA